MTRLLPRTMAGRLAALVVAALIVAQIIAFGIFAAERSDLSRAVARTQLANNLATLIRVLDYVPATTSADVLRGFSSRRQHFSISNAPLVASETIDGGSREMSERVRRLLGASARQVRIFLKPDVGRNSGPRKQRVATGDPQALDVSVQLTSGGWLNGETLLRLPAAPGGNVWLWLLIPSLLSTLVAVLIGVRWITGPMVVLAQAAERIGRGASVEPLTIDGPIEVSRTVDAFNLMQDRLSRFLADRLAMLAAISHDLRTPITVARLRAETVEDEEVREAFVRSLDEMKVITESTLSFARDEWAPEESRPVDLPSLVDAIADDLRTAGHTVDVIASPSFFYRCKPAMLKRALANLMANAAKFGQRAVVSFEDADTDVRIRIDDDGPGLRADQLDRVFEPFARGEPSRNEQTGGIGLGLPIARSIVKAHGGDIRLTSLQRGLRAEVFLPR
ncbi:MAG: two component system sensor histidine kinase [Hyphomicrobiales bacterium]|nr:two component system sensor histidine kinase [Hyphomicrobiales bacterium]